MPVAGRRTGIGILRTRIRTSGCAARSPSVSISAGVFDIKHRRACLIETGFSFPDQLGNGLIKFFLTNWPLDFGRLVRFYIRNFRKRGVFISLHDCSSFESGLVVGGTWNNSSNNGRWASNWNNAPSNTNNSIGLRCAVPLSLDRLARVSDVKHQ